MASPRFRDLKMQIETAVGAQSYDCSASRGADIAASRNLNQASFIKRVLLSARLKQIRWSARLVSLLSRSHTMAVLIRIVGSSVVGRALFDWVAAYRRIFPSLAEGSAVASRFIPADHSCVDCIQLHMTVYKKAQPSDYPVLFHLSRLVVEPVTILDVGGSAGSLYYCYSNYVDLSHAECWTVLEVPFVAEFGRQLALERNECRLRFTATLEAVGRCDILLASGSLHYFESPLPDLIRELPHKPKHVIVNRTPLSDLPSVVTVQDAGKFLVACRVHHRKELICGMEALSYELVDSLRVPGHSIQIPFYPEYSVPEYSGLYFRLKSTTESS